MTSTVNLGALLIWGEKGDFFGAGTGIGSLEMTCWGMGWGGAITIGV